MHALSVALGLVAALAAGLAPAAGHARARIERASCPPGVANCRVATGHVAYVESYDRDGDGDAHYVLLGGDVTAPGLSVIDVARALRPARLPRVGDEVSAAGPVYPGTYGQHQIQATEIHYSPRTAVTATPRVFEQALRVGLGDAGPGGRARLDAIARWLQDVAYADVEQVGLADRAAWVLRRVRLVVDAFPAFGDHLALRTACSGLGRMWAERTTTIAGGRARIEAVALWVALDPQTGRPLTLGRPFLDVYAASAAGRRVRARLRHPEAPAGADVVPWRFRRADLDLMGHVNNAAYWQPLEEEFRSGAEPTRLVAELEFRGGADAGEASYVRAGNRRWICQPSDVPVASIVLEGCEAGGGDPPARDTAHG